MRTLKLHPILKPANNYVIDSPQPSNISYWWNVGSLLGLSLGIQIITGVTLAMHYSPSVAEAFNSVEHIMRDVNSGWLVRYLHSNTASAFFFLVYLHIGRGLYYGSYKSPRTLVWTIGTTIFILMMATAFLGYVLPYGQMSLWGATVITNLMSAIPWIGQDIVEFVWGGFSVNNATLNRFFSLHFILPFILAALALIHLVSLHDSAGSNNPLAVSGNYDRSAFAPYFIFKDTITIFIFMFVLASLIFFVPNVLGDSENYVMANPMQTPPAIVPEWYLLPFYAVLRSIPNKLVGVIAMFSAILVILITVLSDLSKLRGTQFKPASKTNIFTFLTTLILLMILGGKHVESPFIEFGQFATLLYFLYVAFTVPFTSAVQNSINEFFNTIKNTFEKATVNSYNTTVTSDLGKNFLIIITVIFGFYLVYASYISYNTPVLCDSSTDSESYFMTAHPIMCPHCKAEGWTVWNRPGEACIRCGKITGGTNMDLVCSSIAAVKCPSCLANGSIVWVRPGEVCPRCGNGVPATSMGLVDSAIAAVLMCFGGYNLESLNLLTLSTEYCDVPRPWGLYFQDSASPQMEALVELHDNIFGYLVCILLVVAVMLWAILREYQEDKVPVKYVSHGATVELVWTVSPGLILILIAFTSFKLLYLIDEVSDINMTFYIEGHQWYWTYQYPDFLDSDGEFIEYDSYLIPESDLENGALRMLDVDERVIIPEVTHARFIVTSGDVIHSYACPSLGIKADAYPGRLNQASTLINRLGTFYGQCSEICGILHSSMPISIESVTLEKFLTFITSK